MTYDPTNTLAVDRRQYQASTNRLLVEIDNRADQPVHAEVEFIQGGETAASTTSEIDASGESVILTDVENPHGQLRVAQSKTVRGPQADGPITPGESTDESDESVHDQPPTIDRTSPSDGESDDSGDQDLADYYRGYEGGTPGGSDDDTGTESDTTDDTEASSGVDRQTLAIAGVAGLAGLAYLSGGGS